MSNDEVKWLENRQNCSSRYYDPYQSVVNGHLIYASSIGEPCTFCKIVIYPETVASVEILAEITLSGIAARSWKRIAEVTAREMS